MEDEGEGIDYLEIVGARPLDDGTLLQRIEGQAGAHLPQLHGLCTDGEARLLGAMYHLGEVRGVMGRVSPEVRGREEGSAVWRTSIQSLSIATVEMKMEVGRTAVNCSMASSESVATPALACCRTMM